MKYFNFPFISPNSFFFSFVVLTSQVSYAQPSDSGFNVFCVSNRDNTGTCTNLVSSDSYNCIIIPGQVINCVTKDNFNFQCVFVAQYTNFQSDFFCKQFNSSSSSYVIPSADSEISHSDSLASFPIST